MFVQLGNKNDLILNGFLFFYFYKKGFLINPHIITYVNEVLTYNSKLLVKLLNQPGHDLSIN